MTEWTQGRFDGETIVFDEEDAEAVKQRKRAAPLDEKVEEAGRVLQLAAEMSRRYYGAPLIVTYSGGKDSDVMLNIAERYLSPDEFEVVNSHTTVDAPETVYHIREQFARLNDKGIKATTSGQRSIYDEGDEE